MFFRPDEHAGTEPPHAAGVAWVGTGTRMERDRERRLVDAATADPGAFGELYDFYLPRIYGFIHRRLRERSVTEDITATTFERAYTSLRQGRLRNDAFGGWLYRVASNAVVDHVRASRRIVDGVDPDALDPAGDLLAAAVDRDVLRRAMARISTTHRRVLALRYFDDLDPEEAGAVLGCSRRTFAVKLHRAIAALRQAMADEATELMEVGDVA
jgi:RNA polymerase sigma-70 factor (ECF subfamily)